MITSLTRSRRGIVDILVSVGSAGNERQVQNVAAGVLSATSTDAVNGSQLFATATAVNNLGASVATTLGAGAKLNPDGTVATPPAFAVAGKSYSDVGSALAAAQNGAPLQYSTAGKPTTADPLHTPSNNTTLVGAAAGPVILSNVANGALTATSSDAVNGSQLFNTASTTASALGGGAALDPATGKVTAPAYSIAATTYNDVGSALGALDKSVNGGAGIKYFHTKSTLADSTPLGTDSVAIHGTFAGRVTGAGLIISSAGIEFLI